MIVISNNECPQINIFTNGNKLKQKGQFKYLDTLISSDGPNNIEIASRIIAKGKKKFPENEIGTNNNNNNKQTKNKQTNKQTNSLYSHTTKRALEFYIEPILMYGCEAWTILKQFQKELGATENIIWFLRRKLRISWTEKKSFEPV